MGPFPKADLFGVVSLKSELAWRLAPGILAPIEIHAPGAPEGEGGTTGFEVLPLACAGAAASGMRGTEGQLANCSLEAPEPLAKWPRVAHSLFIEATAAAGRVAELGERFGDLSVQAVSQGARHALPDQDDHDDDGILTAVSHTLLHQAHDLLGLAAASDHLARRRTGKPGVEGGKP